MESLAEVSCTGTAQGVDEDVWTFQVQNAFRKSVEEMKLDVEGIDLSEVSQRIIDSLGEVVEDLMVKLYRDLDHQKLYIVGKQDDVKRASHKVKQTLAGPKKSKVMEVKSFQAQYLKLSNTETKSMENFPSVSIDVDTHGNKVNLEGPTKDLDQVQIWLHEILAKLCSKSHSFKTDLAGGIMKGQTFTDKLENENIKVVWQFDSPRSITLFSERDDDIKKAKEFIGENVCEEVISLDPASASNLGTASWREEKRALIQTHEGSVEMSEDSNTISVAATNDVFQEVIDSIDKFFEIRTVRHVLVPVEVPKVRFLRQHCMHKAKNIERKLQDEKVHIDFEEESYTSGVKIAGLKEGIGTARKDMEKLLENIKCKDCKIPAPGIKTFFKKGNGKEILTGIEQSTNTIICPKEAHKRRKPLRTWTTSAGIVSVVKGDLCQMKVDAIVYAATKDLKLVTGLGKAIAEKGGKGIQDEAARVVKDKGQLSECDVVSTGSGHLPCKHVLHARLPKYKADAKGEHKIKTVLINILKKCDKKNIHSIGLPALGSSNGYPLEEVVKVIVETLNQLWISGLGAEVREVVLCDPKPENTKLFIKTCDAVFAGARPRRQTAEEDEDEDEDEDGDWNEDDFDSSGSGSESYTNSSDDEKDLSTCSSDTGPESPSSITGDITVITGEISKQTADVLVNPTNKELNLSIGAVSKSLLKDGGYRIQTECREKYPSGINIGEVASTKGGKLKCKEIFHGVLQVWKKDDGDRAESVLGSFVAKCLKKADSRGYQSIAFPALGTGKLGFPADVSANLMHDTAADFLKTASSLTTVTFVVHAKDTAVKKAYETEVIGPISSSGCKPSSQCKTVWHRAHGGEVSRRPDKNEDEIVLSMYSDSRDNIKQAQERIIDLCRNEYVERVIREPYEQIIESFGSEEMSDLREIANKVTLKQQNDKILIQGKTKDVVEAEKQILDRFTKIQKSNHMKKKAKNVANFVQWCYVVGCKSKPFTGGLNCFLEKAYNEKKTEAEIKDSRGRTQYTVDFKEMIEYPIGRGKPIKIERFEQNSLIEGELEALGGTKTVYLPLLPKRHIKDKGKNAEDDHFTAAESRFRLLGLGGKYRVTKVEYVVNPTLRKRFGAAKDSLKKKRRDITSEPVLTFHNTDEGNIRSICKEGFKPESQGIIFNEYPDYSIDFIKDASKLLLCKVVTGHVYRCPDKMHGAKLQTGYDSHLSPDGKELIIYDTDCILPYYIVHYDQSAGGYVSSV